MTFFFFSPHEPASDKLPRTENVYADAIMAQRVERVNDRAPFTAIDTTKEALGADVSLGLHTQEKMAKLICAWDQSKVQSEVEQGIDAVARAHGEPVTMSTAGLVSC